LIQPFEVKLEVDKELGTAELKWAGVSETRVVTKTNEIIQAVHALQQQLGLYGADITTLSGWLECSAATVTRHTDRLVKSGILVTRSSAPGEKGGRPKKVFDVKGGED
jgi:predicted ArsR family transcriptional regulator